MLNNIDSELIFTTTFIVIFIFLLTILGLCMMWFCVIGSAMVINKNVEKLNKDIKSAKIVNERIEKNIEKINICLDSKK